MPHRIKQTREWTNLLQVWKRKFELPAQSLLRLCAASRHGCCASLARSLLALSLSLSRDLDLLPADRDSRIPYLCCRAVTSVFMLQNATGVVNSLERTQTSSSFGFLFCFRLLEDVCANVLFWFFTVNLRAAVEVPETGGRENR